MSNAAASLPTHFFSTVSGAQVVVTALTHPSARDEQGVQTVLCKILGNSFETSERFPLGELRRVDARVLVHLPS